MSSLNNPFVKTVGKWAAGIVAGVLVIVIATFLVGNGEKFNPILAFTQCCLADIVEPTPIQPLALSPTIWNYLLSDWVDPPIEIVQDGQVTIATGPFYFKVEDKEGIFRCGVVAPGVRVDANALFGRPFIEHWPVHSPSELKRYLTSADDQNNNTNDMEDFCLDSPGYQPTIVFQDNQELTIMDLHIPLAQPTE